MQRIQYDTYGGPEVMHLEDFKPPSPGKGEVLVRVRAASGNPMDWKVRNGTLKFMTGRRFPRGMGHDFAGIVEGVGHGVTRFRIGDAVLGATSMKASGAFAEMVVADENHLVSKPAEISYEQAAALPTAGVTAWQCIMEKGKLRAGEHVFINGCLGGVGRFAAQIALRHGASVGGSCRDTATEDAEALGLDPVVGFNFDPAAIQGQFDLVFDTAGTMSIKDERKLLKPGGRIVDINLAPAKLPSILFARDFRQVFAKYSPTSLSAVASAVAHGEVELPVARVVPLSDAIDALTELEQAGTPKGGKLVITTQ